MSLALVLTVLNIILYCSQFYFIPSPPRVSKQELQNASVLVLANKQDMKNSMSAAEISQSLTLGSLNARSWHVQACCALTGEGYVCFLGLCMFICAFCMFKMFPSPDLSESLFI